MKKFLFALLALAAVNTACQKEEAPDEVSPETRATNFDVQIPANHPDASKQTNWGFPNGWVSFSFNGNSVIPKEGGTLEFIIETKQGSYPLLMDVEDIIYDISQLPGNEWITFQKGRYSYVGEGFFKVKTSITFSALPSDMVLRTVSLRGYGSGAGSIIIAQSIYN